MLRILGQLTVYGDKASIERLVAKAHIPSGSIKQVGHKRKIPEADSWSYASPWYRFRNETLDPEVQDFLVAHKRLGEALAAVDGGIRHAMFTVCPVEQSDEEVFACLLSPRTLGLLAELNVALEISPAVVMPDVGYWRDDKRE